jgi:uncharacterized protein
MINQRAIFSRLLPFAAYILLLALDNTLADLFRWLNINVKFTYLVRISLVLALLVYFWREYVELKHKPILSDLVYASISGCIVFIIWIFPYPSWLVGNDTQGFNPFYGEDPASAVFWVSVRVMGAALIVPLMEELFWRSFVMRWFDQHDFLNLSPDRISSFAYIGSACLFAIEHNLWLAGLFAGMVYGELYKTYKNLWVPIFAHAVTNALLATWVIYAERWNYW